MCVCVRFGEIHSYILKTLGTGPFSQMAVEPSTYTWVMAMVQSISKARDFARYAAQTWKEVINE